MPVVDPRVPICPICLDNIWEGWETHCGHRFHEDCLRPWIIQNWRRPTCPVCREVCWLSTIDRTYAFVLFLGMRPSNREGNACGGGSCQPNGTVVGPDDETDRGGCEMNVGNMGTVDSVPSDGSPTVNRNDVGDCGGGDLSEMDVYNDGGGPSNIGSGPNHNVGDGGVGSAADNNMDDSDVRFVMFTPALPEYDSNGNYIVNVDNAVEDENEVQFVRYIRASHARRLRLACLSRRARSANRARRPRRPHDQ